MPHTLAIPPGVEYIAFSEVSVLTSAAIVPPMPDEDFLREFHRAAVQVNHEHALEQAAQKRIVIPRNPMSFEPDSSSIGDYAAKRVVHVDQVRAFIKLLGIDLVTIPADDDSAVPVVDEALEPMVRRKIFADLRATWPTIVTDFENASRTNADGTKGNGLERCRVPGKSGMYYKALVVEWGRKNGKIQSASAANNIVPPWLGPSRRHTCEG